MATRLPSKARTRVGQPTTPPFGFAKAQRADIVCHRIPTEYTRSNKETHVPLSGEAIRTMNYVDDISVTLRRILSVLPVLTPEERERVAEHIRKADPSYESVLTAVAAK
jgi:hypothetical protein